MQFIQYLNLRLKLSVTFCVILVAAIYPFASNAQTLKLNHPISGPVDVFFDGCCSFPSERPTNDFQVSPDGQRAVYWVRDFLTNEVVLYSVMSDGSGHVILSQNFPNNNPFYEFAISPDSSQVVYYADSKIFSVPIAGGTPTVLVSSSVNSSSDFKISKDSDLVIYVNSTTSQLHSVPISGGSSTLLSPNVVNRFTQFKLSTDGRNIIYLGSLQTSIQNELFSLSLIDSGETQLTSVLSSIGSDVSVSAFEISPDNDNVVFVARMPSTAEGLYSVPIEGGMISQITPLDFVPSDSSSFKVQISPDGNHVLLAYSVRRPDDGFDIFLREIEVVLIPITGDTFRKIGSRNLRIPNSTENSIFTPDSSRIVYSSATSLTCEVEFPELCSFNFNLFSESIDGDDVQQLSPNNTNRFFQLTTDGERVVFTSRDSQTINQQIFSVSLDDRELIRLNGFLPRRKEVLTYNLSPDGRRVLYLADQDTDGVFELFSASTSVNNEAQKSKFVIRASNGNLILIEL